MARRRLTDCAIHYDSKSCTHAEEEKKVSPFRPKFLSLPFVNDEAEPSAKNFNKNQTAAAKRENEILFATFTSPHFNRGSVPPRDERTRLIYNLIVHPRLKNFITIFSSFYRINLFLRLLCKHRSSQSGRRSLLHLGGR
jgi:hypothetical protein